MSKNKNSALKNGLHPKPFQALTSNQEKFDKYYDNIENHIVAIGYPGTGKTYIASHLACESVLEDKTHKQIVIFRSAVPSRNIGFLPGNADEKMSVYNAPYVQSFNKIFGRDDAFGILCKKNILNFESTSFSRGISVDDSIVIVEEFQNMTFQELDTIFTRCGKNTKYIFCGDLNQCDLPSFEGAEEFMRILRKIPEIKFIDFDVDDIVRSDIVKKYIIAKHSC